MPPDAPAYYVGLDLGQVADYTGVAVAECRELPTGAREPVPGSRRVTVRSDGTVTAVPEQRDAAEKQYRLRHLERLPLGLSYVKQAERVAALLATPQLEGARLIVDQTGVGRAVVDIFRAAGLGLTGITITGGNEVIRAGRDWHVPKRDLVGVVQVLLQGRRLKVAPALAEAATLTRELEAFEVRLSPAGHDSYNAREGEHDDLVLAVAVALWAAERPTKRWQSW